MPLALVLSAAGILLGLLVLQYIYLAVVLMWEDRRTVDLAYYGRPPAEREAFKRLLRVHALLLAPVLRLVARPSVFTFEKSSFREGGVTGPRGTCGPESFSRGMAYEPRPEDVFVVTQMKCGTTWMQHLVYQILERGAGDLVETGRTLYSVSPWLEARKSVPVGEAPLVGTGRPTRIIKTHLPAEACPFSREARYIYVARHPVSCFASCVDFLRENLGRAAPELEPSVDWFCSEEAMWWGSWADHVAGWWERAEGRDNVLFVRFEDMKRDLRGVAERVASFLGVDPLSDDEMAGVLEKCGFDYMSRHAEAFEMHPPHLLAADARLFVRGTAARHRDVPEEVRTRIGRWTADRAETLGYPLSLHYPEVAPSAGARAHVAGVPERAPGAEPPESALAD